MNIKKCTFALLLLMVCLFTLKVEAISTGAPAPTAPCPANSIDMVELNGVCWSLKYGSSPLIGAGGVFKKGGGLTMRGEFNLLYVPSSGNYGMRMHICPSRVVKSCTLHNASYYMDSNLTPYFSSFTRFGAGDHNFGGNKTSLSNLPAFNMCFTLVDDKGNEWASATEGMSCKDANELLTTPALCEINHGQDISVEFGSLEREGIASAALTTASIKKQISVACIRDAKITLDMRIQYSPIDIGGQKLVKSTTNGLGIAIIYNGKVMAPTDSVTLNYGSGVNNLDLEFEAVRDPKMKLEDIKTGAFTANAVIVMTEQ